jgi:hypothetical protein
LRESRGGGSLGAAAVGARERMSVGRGHARVRGGGWSLGAAAVGARERMSVGRRNVRESR